MADPDTVEVWSIDAHALAPPAADLAALLDDDERRRAAALGPEDRHRFVVAHGAARLILARRLGTRPERLRWRYGRHGKPELVGAALRVSRSHSGGLSLLAVTEHRAVGVDVQRALPGERAARMAARFFRPEEASWVARDPPDRFAGLWARKEACVKAAGRRLVQGLPVPVAGPDDRVVRWAAGDYRLRDLAVPVGWRAAVALAGERRYRVVGHAWVP